MCQSRSIQALELSEGALDKRRRSTVPHGYLKGSNEHTLMVDVPAPHQRLRGEESCGRVELLVSAFTRWAISNVMCGSAHPLLARLRIRICLDLEFWQATGSDAQIRATDLLPRTSPHRGRGLHELKPLGLRCDAADVPDGRVCRRSPNERPLYAYCIAADGNDCAPCKRQGDATTLQQPRVRPSIYGDLLPVPFHAYNSR